MTLAQAKAFLDASSIAYQAALDAARIRYHDGREHEHQDVVRLRREMTYWQGEVDRLSGSTNSKIVMKATWNR